MNTICCATWPRGLTKHEHPAGLLATSGEGQSRSEHHAAAPSRRGAHRSAPRRRHASSSPSRIPPAASRWHVCEAKRVSRPLHNTTERALSQGDNGRSRPQAAPNTAASAKLTAWLPSSALRRTKIRPRSYQQGHAGVRNARTELHSKQCALRLPRESPERSGVPGHPRQELEPPRVQQSHVSALASLARLRSC